MPEEIPHLVKPWKPHCGPPAPHRVMLSRKHGWSMPPNTRKVDRSTPFGNPFRVGDRVGGETIHTVEDMLARYKAHAIARICLPEWQALKGLNLACWCKLNEPCHADILLELLNPPKPRKP